MPQLTFPSEDYELRLGILRHQCFLHPALEAMMNFSVGLGPDLGQKVLFAILVEYQFGGGGFGVDC